MHVLNFMQCCSYLDNFQTEIQDENITRVDVLSLQLLLLNANIVLYKTRGKRLAIGIVYTVETFFPLMCSSRGVYFSGSTWLKPESALYAMNCKDKNFRSFKIKHTLLSK